MTKAHVIIGANFGDEGKGLVTDYLVANSKARAIVVRFNGGAQAGHTVQLDNGIRHIFRHFGSGTLSGAATYLSRFFISNPILFCQEYHKLKKLKQHPQVYVDPSSIVTTPYDMLINQIAEKARSNNRHGSCGVGIGETVERNLYKDFSFTVEDCFSSKEKLADKLELIRKTWLPKRLIQLGVAAISKVDQQQLDSEFMFSRFLQDIDFFKNQIKLADINIVTKWEEIFFEGAQGLLLDQEYGCFPYVTRSYTGIKNVIKLVSQLKSSALDIKYVTRTYLTRHGAGPLPNEMACPYPFFEDRTNIKHTFQGTLRFAPLSVDLLKSSIMTDLNKIPDSIDGKFQLVVTCLDQTGDDIFCVHDNSLVKCTQKAFLQLLAKELNCNNILRSYGPTRNKVFAGLLY